MATVHRVAVPIHGSENCAGHTNWVHYTTKLLHHLIVQVVTIESLTGLSTLLDMLAHDIRLLKVSFVMSLSH